MIHFFALVNMRGVHWQAELCQSIKSLWVTNLSASLYIIRENYNSVVVVLV